MARGSARPLRCWQWVVDAGQHVLSDPTQQVTGRNARRRSLLLTSPPTSTTPRHLAWVDGGAVTVKACPPFPNGTAGKQISALRELRKSAALDCAHPRVVTKNSNAAREGGSRGPELFGTCASWLACSVRTEALWAALVPGPPGSRASRPFPFEPYPWPRVGALPWFQHPCAGYSGLH